MVRSKGTGDVVAQARVEGQSICEAEWPPKTSPLEPGTCDCVRFHGKAHFPAVVDFTNLRGGYRGWSWWAPLTAGALKSISPAGRGRDAAGRCGRPQGIQRDLKQLGAQHARAGAEMSSPHAGTREGPLGTPSKAQEGTRQPGQAPSQHQRNHLGN